MALDDTDRLMIEDMISECQFATSKYLETGKDAHAKMLGYNIEQCLEILKEYEKDLKVDPENDKYKLHLFVPFQVNEMIQMRGK